MVKSKHFCRFSFWSFPFQPAAHSQYNAQKPKVSVRWQPLDPKYIGALTLRGSYTEAFHAPALSRFRRLLRRASQTVSTQY